MNLRFFPLPDLALEWGANQRGDPKLPHEAEIQIHHGLVKG